MERSATLEPVPPLGEHESRAGRIRRMVSGHRTGIRRAALLAGVEFAVVVAFGGWAGGRIDSHTVAILFVALAAGLAIRAAIRQRLNGSRLGAVPARRRSDRRR
jgi:hypothetical protein